MNAGFSYLEVLIATALIAISLVPAMEALSIGSRGHALQAAHAEDHYYLVAKLEEVLAGPGLAEVVDALIAEDEGKRLAALSE